MFLSAALLPLLLPFAGRLPLPSFPRLSSPPFFPASSQLLPSLDLSLSPSLADHPFSSCSLNRLPDFLPSTPACVHSLAATRSHRTNTTVAALALASPAPTASTGEPVRPLMQPVIPLFPANIRPSSLSLSHCFGFASLSFPLMLLLALSPAAAPSALLPQHACTHTHTETKEAGRQSASKEGGG